MAGCGLAGAYAVQGKTRQAVDAYDHAAALKPGDPAIKLQTVAALLSGLKPEDELPPRAVTLLNRGGGGRAGRARGAVVSRRRRRARWAAGGGAGQVDEIARRAAGGRRGRQDGEVGAGAIAGEVTGLGAGHLAVGMSGHAICRCSVPGPNVCRKSRWLRALDQAIAKADTKAEMERGHASNFVPLLPVSPARGISTEHAMAMIRLVT